MSKIGNHVFIGGRDRGLRWLERLAERGQSPRIVYCLQEEDHEVEKHHHHIQRFCTAHSLPVRLRRKLSAEDVAEIAALQPDLLVVMGWRTLIPQAALGAARFGAVGVHESLLPAYRGFAPINWAIINGESQTGVTLFYITATGVDDGDIVAQVPLSIGPTETAASLYQRAADASLAILDEHFVSLLSGTAPRSPQDERAATYTCSRTPEDGQIDWNWPTAHIDNLVRGLTHPYPGAITSTAGKRYRIWSGVGIAPPKPFVGRIPGRVVAIRPGQGVEVLTGDGAYLVKSASLEGEAPAPAESMFRSVRLTLA